MRTFPIVSAVAAALLFSQVPVHAGGAAPLAVAPLKLAGFSPAAGAKDVCIDTPLRLKFEAPPTVAKSGTVQILDDAGTVVDSIDLALPTATKTIGGLNSFNYYPVVVTGNEAVISFKNSLLSYGKTYTVKLPNGTFLDKAGSPAALEGTQNWRFTTKAAVPVLTAKEPRVTIAADGSGDFATLQGALDFIPAANTTPTTLFLKKGTYNEIVYVTNKHNLTILGEDRKASILAATVNQNLNNTDRSAMPGGYRRGLLRAVNCNDLVIANLTLHNTTPQGGGQAEAIILNGRPDAHAIVTGVDMYSYQDTLQINGQAYVSNCYIEGDVDFMWGTGPVYFEKCECKSLKKNAYYTQIRNTVANHGYVYNHCTFNGAPMVTGNFLSRIDSGRFPASEVVLLNCTLTDAVGDVAWRFDNANAGAAPGVHFWEYNSLDPTGKPIDASKRFAASKQLAKDADAESIANYSNPAWVLGGNWTPKVPAIP